MARISTLAGGAADVAWRGDVVGVEVVGVVGEADAPVAAVGPVGSGEPAQLASIAAMAVIVAAATGVAVRSAALRMPPTPGLRPVVSRSVTLMGRHTVPIVATGADRAVRTAPGGVCAAPDLGAAPVPGAPRCARTRSGGPFGHLCAAPHLEAPHDPRRRLETGERRGSSCTTHSQRRGAGALGRWRALVELPHDIPDISLTNAFGPRVRPRVGPAQRTLAQTSLRRGLGQGAIASKCGTGSNCVEVCGAGSHCVEVWGSGVLRRNVEHGIGARDCPRLARRARGAAPGGLRWMWDRSGGTALGVGLGWAGCGAELGVGLGWVRGWRCGTGGQPERRGWPVASNSATSSPPSHAPKDRRVPTA